MNTGPFLDLTKQIVAASLPRGDTADELAVRQVLLEASAGTPFWGDDPEAYSTVRFAKNIFLPGQCRLKGKGFAQRLQRDQAPGTHGAKVKQFGIQPARFSIVIRMWTAEHLRSFERLVPILKSQRYTTETKSTGVGYTGNANGAGFSGVVAGTASTTTKRLPAGPAALDVYHPILALFKIRSVHITEVSFPEPSGDGDVWEAELECEEHVWKPAAVKTADQSLAIVESNPRVGTTAGTLALEKKPATRPSKFTKTPFGGGASGGW